MKDDSVGDGISTIVGDWTFSGETSVNFDEHVSRSVPLYYEGHDLICKISDFFLSRNSLCYEFGCSTGSLLRKLSEHNKNKDNIKFVGIDIEKDMIKEATSHHTIDNVTFECSDILDYDLEKSDLIISYYTAQFVKARDRQRYFDKIYSSLNWGGALLLFEKVRAPDARFQDVYTGLYNDFKIDNGYSTSQIYNKSKSLTGVLDPFSEDGNIDLLERSGFVDITTIMKYICFTGFVAIK
jgi:tRNA (cmo5U34)-methyltransferase